LPFAGGGRTWAWAAVAITTAVSVMVRSFTP
jgi:hypothetical protein